MNEPAQPGAPADPAEPDRAAAPAGTAPVAPADPVERARATAPAGTAPVAPADPVERTRATAPADPAEPVLAAALQRLVGTGDLTAPQAGAVRAEFHVAYAAALRDRAPAGTGILGAAQSATGLSPAGPPGAGHSGAGHPATGHSATGRPAGTEPASSPAAAPSASWTSILSEVGGYVGAIFVSAAAAVMAEPQWLDLSRPAKVALLAVPGVLLLIAAVVVAITVRPGPVVAERGPRRRLIGALVLAGGGMLASAYAMATETGDGMEWTPVVALLVWGVGYALCRGALLHLATAAAVLWTLEYTLWPGPDGHYTARGLLLVVVGAVWAGLALAGLVRERALGFAVAGTMAFVGAEGVVLNGGVEWAGYLLLGLLALVGLGGYVGTRELSALAVGAVSLAVVVPQAVIHWTDGTLGAAGGLLVSGLSVVAVSVLVARLHAQRDAAGRDAASVDASGPAQLV